MPNRPGSWPAVACILAGVLLAGCSSATSASAAGPLGKDATLGQEVICSPARGGILGFGNNVFANGGTATAVIQDVTLDKPRHLRLLAAYTVPITGHDLYGVMPGNPPYRPLAPGIQWSQRQNAEGAHIPPAHDGSITNVILALRPTAASGFAAGISIDYQESGQQYHMLMPTNIVVTNGQACPANLNYSP